MGRNCGPILRFVVVYPEVFPGLEAAIVRISAVGPEIVRGGVLRNLLRTKLS